MIYAAMFTKLICRQRRRPHRVGGTPSLRASLLLEPLECRAVPSAVHILTNEHTDLDVTYSPAFGKLQLAENNKSVDPIAYYPADHVILEFLAGAKRPQTADPRFAFTGAAPGQPIWVVPISPRDPALLQLGVSGERIDSSILGSYNETDPRINNVIPFPWIRLNVLNVQGPGQFSVWQTNDFGSPTVWVASAGNPSPNLFFTGPGGHIDYNWAFTAPGNYKVDIQASAFLADSTPVSSDVTTYYFQVDDTPTPPPGAPGGGSPPSAEVAKEVLMATESQILAGSPALTAGLLPAKPLATSTQTNLLGPAVEPLLVPLTNDSWIGEEHQDVQPQDNSTVEPNRLGDLVGTTDLGGNTILPNV